MSLVSEGKRMRLSLAFYIYSRELFVSNPNVGAGLKSIEPSLPGNKKQETQTSICKSQN